MKNNGQEKNSDGRRDYKVNVAAYQIFTGLIQCSSNGQIGDYGVGPNSRAG